jgi:predicted RND superfamily exporter protein
VHFLARWRVITLPVTAVLAVFALWGALQVESAFELEDFFSPETDFIKSVDRFNVHYSTQSGGDGYIYVEGDLTDPQTIRAMEVALVEVDESGVELGRNLDGEMEVFDSAIDVVRISTLSGPMRDAAAVRGVEITDTDGDGIADDASQIAAIYAVAGAEGVVDDDANLVYRPDQVETFLNTAVDGSAAVQATRLQVVVPTITDDEIILGVRGALDAAAVNLESNTEDEVTVISVSGGSITQQAGLAAFTDAMLVALPIAIVITVILALIFMRSFRYALVSMVPILLVVAWVYGYMFLRDHAINPITATIAAIAVGVGIDYATHFTMRFRQEFEHEPSRFPAIRRAGEGTGGALAISALTSMIGFAVLANAPAPLFATFGELMAVMIFFALVVSLLVLPSLLVLVTPSRRGEERAEMEASITKGEFDYEPHARDTALRRGGEQEDPEPAPA